MKRFIIKTLFYCIPFVCIYGGCKIVIDGFYDGDIGRLGKISFGNEYSKSLKENYLQNKLTIDTLIVTYEKLQIPNVSKKIFTIGDSFSKQGIFGYQNYLAHLLKDSIVNIEIYGGHLLTAVSLLNSGIIDSSNCQIMILQTVDRNLIVTLNSTDFEVRYKLPKTGMQKVKDLDEDSQNKKNTKKDSELYNLCSYIRLRWFNYNNPILEHSLKQECFTHNKFSRKLFYYKDDMNFRNTSKADISKAKENLILLNKKFSEKGIKLIFLIAADKYDVYRPFTVDNTLPVDTTTDELSQIPGVCVIDTKPMLQEMVRNGEKDVYMVNDTHWSYKGSEAVARKLAHTIDSIEILK